LTCRIAAATAFVGLLLLLPAAIGAADPGVTPDQHGIAGAVPADGPGPGNNGQGNAYGHCKQGNCVNLEASGAGLGSGNLAYHGGPVMHSNTTYLIFWSPGNTISASYESTITQFFTDVAADSGKNTNVYSTDPQYTDTSGQGANYASHFGGAWIDTSTTIPNHCSGEYQGTGISVNGCVLDSDLQTEVLNALSQNSGWSAGMTSIFLVFTPQNVGSCADSSSKDCAFSDYCAYHSYFTHNSTNVIYTNQPYTDTTGVGAPGVCDSGEQPNGNWADETINVASHEQNESITDPLINAWYDSAGYEDGDKCAWIFGSPVGTAPDGATYNQMINGHFYYLQQEWNNAGSNCVQNTTPPPPPPSAPTISGYTPAAGGPAGTPVTINGQNFSGATSVKFNGTTATYTVSSDGSSISTSVPAGAKTGPITVTTPGGTATSSSFTIPAPDFTLALDTQTLSVARNSSGNVSVTIARVNGFTGTVSVTVSGLPGQTSASISPSQLGNGATGSTLKISPSRRARTGSSTVTVTATSGTLRHTSAFTLTIT
jgi:hypothetical protein